MSVDPELETTVKMKIYDTVARTTRVPSIAELARDLFLAENEIRQAFQSLGDQRLLALKPGSGEIRMAPPFSAIATQHEVYIAPQCYFANCIWDAFGIAAALHADAEIRTTCADCGESMSLRVHDGAVELAACVIHYAVPAAHWWDDIVHT